MLTGHEGRDGALPGAECSRQEHASAYQDQQGQELVRGGAEAGEKDIRTMLASRTLSGTVSEMGSIVGVRAGKP